MLFVLAKKDRSVASDWSDPTELLRADPMTTVRIRDAATGDLDQLIAMNLQLIEDEQYDVPLGRDELRKRMEGFLKKNFRVFIFGIDGVDEPAGYAVVDMSCDPAYLRHFFVSRPMRRRRIGRTAFEMICNLLAVESIDVEVMAWNDAGRLFWRSLGFQHRYEGLRKRM